MSEQNTGASRPWPECQDFDAHQLLRLAITEDTARAEMFRRIAGKLETCQWRPIETAPRDGTRLLLGGPGWVAFGCVSAWRGDVCMNDDGVPIIGATSWKPSPEPPHAG